jgi:hypothetical protein
MEELKTKYNISPYPSKYSKQTINFLDFKNKYKYLNEKEKKLDESQTLIGRIVNSSFII